MVDGDLIFSKKKEGRFPEDELKALPDGWQVATIDTLEVPGLEAERHMVVLERK